MDNVNIIEPNRKYDFSIEQEVLNEYASGVWSDYVCYCSTHGIALNSDHPTAQKAKRVYAYKCRILTAESCRTIEDLKPIKRGLKELKDEIRRLYQEE